MSTLLDIPTIFNFFFFFFPGDISHIHLSLASGTGASRLRLLLSISASFYVAIKTSLFLSSHTLVQGQILAPLLVPCSV
jgi:hypothetical protein